MKAHESPNLEFRRNRAMRRSSVGHGGMRGRNNGWKNTSLWRTRGTNVDVVVLTQQVLCRYFSEVRVVLAVLKFRAAVLNFAEEE